MLSDFKNKYRKFSFNDKLNLDQKLIDENLIKPIVQFELKYYHN